MRKVSTKRPRTHADTFCELWTLEDCGLATLTHKILPCQWNLHVGTNTKISFGFRWVTLPSPSSTLLCTTCNLSRSDESKNQAETLSAYGFEPNTAPSCWAQELRWCKQKIIIYTTLLYLHDFLSRAVCIVFEPWRPNSLSSPPWQPLPTPSPCR